MAAPFPSFFRIRLWIVAVILILFFLLVGTIKQCLSSETTKEINGVCYTFVFYRVGKYGENLYGYDVTGNGEPFYIAHVSGSPNRNYVSDQFYFYIYELNNISGEWKTSGVNGLSKIGAYTNMSSLQEYSDANWGGLNVLESFDGRTANPNGCEEEPEPCEEEKAALEAECGAANYYINEETCNGRCRCEDDDEDGICNQCDLDPDDPLITNKVYAWKRWRDAGTDATCKVFYTYLLSECRQLYNQNSGDYVDVSTLYAKESNATQCGDGVLTDYIPCVEYRLNGNCDDECSLGCPGGSNFDFGANTGDDSQDTGEEEQDNTPDEEDEDNKKNCIDECYPQSYMYVPATDECICVNDNDGDGTYTPETTQPNDEQPKGGVTPSDDYDTPEVATPSDTPADDATDSEVNRSNTKNNQSTATNTGTMVSQLAQANEYGKTTATNTANTATNTKSAVKELDSMGKDINRLLGGIKNELEGENVSNESLDATQPEAYGTGGESFSWGDRTNQFIEEMKTTGLFSVPTSFFEDTPSGGSSTVQIDGGDTYGTHTLDFANFSNGLIALRVVIQLAFMWVAIRIVTLKR